MRLDHSKEIAGRLDFVFETGSTNTDLVAAAVSNAGEYPDFSVLVAAHQTTGKGRNGRQWQAPAGTSMAVSVLLRPQIAVSPNDFGWLPLLAGLAMTRAVRGLLPGSDVGLKWPNDVLVADRKVSGVLTELLPDLSGVVAGAGLNLTLTREQLPVPTATSLLLEGASLPATDAERFDLALAAYLNELRQLYQAWVEAKANAIASGLQAAVIESCVSIGQEVRAILPGDQELIGKAITVDQTGRLVLAEDGTGQLTALAAADIVHLRQLRSEF